MARPKIGGSTILGIAIVAGSLLFMFVVGGIGVILLSIVAFWYGLKTIANAAKRGADK